MFSQIAFIVAMAALACCLLLALHAVFSEGMNGIRRHKASLYLTFSIYAVAFTLFLVTQ